MTTEVHDDDGILVGWHSTAVNAKGKEVLVFVPRRDENIKEDRANLKAEMADKATRRK